ncbi:acyl carrier protein [Aliiglaciecola sp. LCG003]|uniref:acyl carrier protein n=1 Tax=Aliiglaciecola sp. LCG003 TaxID=3053655 RepID=UPI002572ACE8|nr:acyl carrier protein [Aliiglaciecola sp. LCG003]WJG10574.1 acyl carrier protein [Aliiglaciecola sp. LCG003]
MSHNETLRQTFSTSLGIELDAINDQLSYNSIPQWDSTAHMILIAELENQFNVMLDTDDIIDMSSVAKAKEILAKYDIQFDA